MVALHCQGFPCGSDSKEAASNVGDPGLIPGWGRSPGEGNGNPLQYSAWRIPWTEEPGGLWFTGWQRIDTTEWLCFALLRGNRWPEAQRNREELYEWLVQGRPEWIWRAYRELLLCEEVPASFALSHFPGNCIFYTLKVCDNPVSGKSINAIFKSPCTLTVFVPHCSNSQDSSNLYQQKTPKARMITGDFSQ